MTRNSAPKASHPPTVSANTSYYDAKSHTSSHLDQSNYQSAMDQSAMEQPGMDFQAMEQVDEMQRDDGMQIDMSSELKVKEEKKGVDDDWMKIRGENE